MRAFGFRAIDYNVGYYDGLSGRSYNHSANSDLYDRGYLAGKRQRGFERIMWAITGTATLALIVVQLIGVIPR